MKKSKAEVLLIYSLTLGEKKDDERRKMIIVMNSDE